MNTRDCLKLNFAPHTIQFGTRMPIKWFWHQFLLRLVNSIHFVSIWSKPKTVAEVKNRVYRHSNETESMWRYFEVIEVCCSAWVTSNDLCFVPSFHFKTNNLFAINKFSTSHKHSTSISVTPSKLFSWTNAFIYFIFGCQQLSKFSMFLLYDEKKQENAHQICSFENENKIAKRKHCQRVHSVSSDLLLSTKFSAAFFLCPNKYWFYYQKQFLLQKSNNIVWNEEREKERGQINARRWKCEHFFPRKQMTEFHGEEKQEYKNGSWNGKWIVN